jgi:hypothetical protein
MIADENDHRPVLAGHVVERIGPSIRGGQKEIDGGNVEFDGSDYCRHKLPPRVGSYIDLPAAKASAAWLGADDPVGVLPVPAAVEGPFEMRLS